ncbi:MAG: hypothetical protein E6R13_07400 [Spirochaetes bacterium]|nr:MAG: hypothetical protein E6R13_07400 [Spirochaetota bacterium]
MGIYNPYNEVVQPAKFVAPMDLNLLLKGTQYKQQKSDQHLAEIQNSINNVLAIPAYGKDKEVLNKKIQELQQAMGSLDITDLESPNSKQQVNSLINQFSQDKDVQAVAQRGHSYENMLGEKQEAEKKGNRYINYGLDDLNEYYSGDNYIRDYKFSNNGYLGADVGKIMENIKKTMTPTKTTKTLPNGEVITEEKYDTDALLENTKLQLQNSNWEREIKDRTQRKYKNENIDDYALQHASELESIASQNLSNAYFIYGDPSSTKEQREKAVADIYKSQKDLATANSIKNNPYHGQAFLLGEIDNEKNKSINQVAEALNYHQESLPKLGEAYKMAEEHKHDFAIKAVEHKYRMGEIKAREDAAINKIQELQRLKSLAGNISDPLSRKLIEMGIKKGLTSELLNEEGTGFKTNAELVALGLEPDEQENKPKGEIVRQSTESFREIYNTNKDIVEKAIKDKAGALGFNFDADDIEELTWDKETNRYTVKVDDAGTTQDISFTQDEIDNMSTVKYSKNGEVISIPLTDPDAKAAIEEAEKLGYKKQ